MSASTRWACRRCRPDAVPGSPEWDVRADVVAREAGRFTPLASGAKGIGGIYDLWRRLGAVVTGRRFEPAHRQKGDPVP